jgi:hypothetical protein
VFCLHGDAQPLPFVLCLPLTLLYLWWSGSVAEACDPGQPWTGYDSWLHGTPGETEAYEDTVIPATCTGTADDVTAACTGSANEVAATCTGTALAYLQMTCDLDGAFCAMPLRVSPCSMLTVACCVPQRTRTTRTSAGSAACTPLRTRRSVILIRRQTAPRPVRPDASTPPRTHLSATSTWRQTTQRSVPLAAGTRCSIAGTTARRFRTPPGSLSCAGALEDACP